MTATKNDGTTHHSETKQQKVQKVKKTIKKTKKFEKKVIPASTKPVKVEKE